MRAWDEVFLDAPDGWDRLCERVQGAVREQHPALAGRFTVGFDTGVAARMKDQKIDELVGAVVSCDTQGIGARVDLASGVTIRHTEDGSELTVQPYRVATTWELGPSSQTRFAKTVASTADTLERAGRRRLRDPPRGHPLDPRELRGLAPVARREPTRRRPPPEHLGGRPQQEPRHQDQAPRARREDLSLIILVARRMGTRFAAFAPGEQLARTGRLRSPPGLVAEQNVFDQ